MAGIGKQFKGSGIAKSGFSSKHEQERDHLKSGGLTPIGNLRIPRRVKGELNMLAEGGSTNWIKGAIKHPGALRASLHVKAGEKIPAKKLAAAAKKPGTMGRRARLAQTLKGFKK